MIHTAANECGESLQIVLSRYRGLPGVRRRQDVATFTPFLHLYPSLTSSAPRKEELLWEQFSRRRKRAYGPGVESHIAGGSRIIILATEALAIPLLPPPTTTTTTPPCLYTSP